MALWIVLAVLLTLAAYTDVRKQIIPNWLTISGVAAGILINLVIGGIQGLLDSILACLAGFALFFLLYLFRVLGAGDVKLFASIGSLAGLPFLLECTMYSLLYAGLIGGLILIIRKKFFLRMIGIVFSIWMLIFYKNSNSLKAVSSGNEVTKFPFMYAVVPAALTAGLEQFHWERILG